MGKTGRPRINGSVGKKDFLVGKGARVSQERHDHCVVHMNASVLTVSMVGFLHFADDCEATREGGGRCEGDTRPVKAVHIIQNENGATWTAHLADWG